MTVHDWIHCASTDVALIQLHVCSSVDLRVEKRHVHDSACGVLTSVLW